MAKRGRYGYLLKYLVVLGNLIILNLLFLFLYSLFNHYLSDSVKESKRYILLFLNLSGIITNYYFADTHSNRMIRTDRLLFRAFYWTVLHLIAFGACLLFAKIYDFSRLFLLLFYSVLFLFIFGWWWGVAMALSAYRKSGYNYIRVLIIGISRETIDLIRQMESSKSSGYKIVGYLDNSEQHNSQIAHLPCLGRMSDISEVITKHQIDEVYSPLHSVVPEHMNVLIGLVEKECVRFLFIPPTYTVIPRQTSLTHIGNIPVISVRKEPLEGILNRILKRGFDIVVSILFLTILFPIVTLAVALLMKIYMPGPLFFKQRRTGLSGKVFTCYKFRSMVVNAEADNRQATSDDSRISSFGRILRKWSIDELPQFYNVLRADMSIVGPRPHMEKHTRQYSAIIERYMVRHFVKPGITGWAQVNGYRGETRELWRMEKRVEYDIWYIENWSFLLDLWIILLTLFGGLKEKRE